MEEIGKLSNDELFRLCKSSGINAGPITASTRSVYEKKLRSFLLDVTSESASKSEAPPAAKQPVVELRAIDLDVPVFAKPATPKAKPAIATAAPPAPEQVPEPVHVDKPRRSILRNNNVESRVNEPVQEPITNYYERPAFNAASTIQPTSRYSEVTREPEVRSSPVRQVTKEAPKPEFKLLRQPVQQQQQLPQPIIDSTSHRESNIRKRTATVDRPTPLSSNAPEVGVVTAEKPKANWGSLKFMVMVLLVTAIVYFVMTQMQSNPELPI